MGYYDTLFAKALSGNSGGSSGSGLPSVTSADEGKVLAVNSSGEWDAESPKLVRVNIVNDALDKTWNEIKTGIEDGYVFYLTYVNEEDGGYYASLGLISNCAYNPDDGYSVASTSLDEFGVVVWGTDSPNGYPTN